MTHLGIPGGRAVKVVKHRRGSAVYLWRLDVHTKYGRKRDGAFVGSVSDAQIRIREMKKGMEDAGNRGKTSGPHTISDVLSAWREAKQGVGVSMSRYKRLHREIGGQEVHRAPQALPSLIRALRASHAPSTINRHIAMLKAAFSWASSPLNGLIERNYMAGYPILPENNIRRRYLSDEERRKWWAALPCDMRPLWYYMSRVPSRLSEVISMRRGQIDMIGRKIELPDGSTKNGRGRRLDIPSEMWGYFVSLPAETDHVFFHLRNGRMVPWTVSTVEHHWKKAGIRAGISTTCRDGGYNLHKCRQQAAMQMLIDGYSERVVRLVGGWRSEAAFSRYIDPQILYEIESGSLRFDSRWKSSMAPIAAVG